jgi:hypothetical protein
VTFYDNFHFIEEDRHFVGGSIEGDTEMRIYHVHEVITEEGGPVLSEKDYTEERLALMDRIIVHCEASSGTFRIEFINFESGGEEERIMYSRAIQWEFDAKAVREAVPLPGELDGMGNFVDGIAADPGYLKITRQTFFKGGSVDFPTTEVQASFHDRPDLGPNTVEIRVFYDDGLTAGFEHHGVREHDINLGPIWVTVPAWDETDYSLELEEGECGGSAVPEPEPGAIQIENPCTGRKATFRPVSGHRS